MNHRARSRWKEDRMDGTLGRRVQDQLQFSGGTDGYITGITAAAACRLFLLRFGCASVRLLVPSTPTYFFSPALAFESLCVSVYVVVWVIFFSSTNNAHPPARKKGGGERGRPSDLLQWQPLLTSVNLTQIPFPTNWRRRFLVLRCIGCHF